jgi:hypothetical protein
MRTEGFFEGGVLEGRYVLSLFLEEKSKRINFHSLEVLLNSIISPRRESSSFSSPQQRKGEI